MMRPGRLQYYTQMSWYAQDNKYLRRKVVNAFGYFVLASLFPYVSVKAYNLLDRLPVWN